MKYKAIVLDLDGTLTNSKKELTTRTKEVLMQAQKKGVKVILASGRPTFGIKEIADTLNLANYNGYVLAFNGGKITNWKNKETIFEQKLDKEFVPILYNEAKNNNFEILTYQGECIATTNIHDKYVLEEAFINKMPLIQYDDFLNQIEYSINKCLIVGEPNNLERLEVSLAKKMNGKMNIYRSADFFLECVPLGIDKAASLDRLFSTIGISKEEIIACGDGHNDISMIEYAGLGVAMANADDTVQSKANYVTRSNDEDGVAHVIEKFIL